MSVVSVQPKDFILALFIRDDGERFLLGDKGYDFMDSQLHFAANTIENDEVEKQGADGTMLAGQVRRASVQTFDGYVGDATTQKEEIEQMRRAFIAFFLKGHHYRVIYVDCARNAWQRKGGYLVDAPEVKELFQVHPEYHVGLNFEDVNYYSYDENAEGDEITANLVQVAISSAVEGGLVWDEDGAVSEDAVVEYDGDTATASGTNITISDAVEAPLSDFKLKGETSQQTYTGKNLTPYPYSSSTLTVNGITIENNNNGSVTINGSITSSTGSNVSFHLVNGSFTLPAGTYYVVPIPGAVSTGAHYTLYDGSQYIVLSSSNNWSFTLSAQKTFTQFYIEIYRSYTGSFSNTTLFPMLSTLPGQTSADFEPYVGGVPAPNPDYPQAVQTVTGENILTISDGQGNEQSYTIDLGSIELCKIGTYQDYIYKSGGKWYVHKATGKLVVDGSETGWLISASSGSPDYYYARTNAKDGVSVSNYYGGYCNNLTNRGKYVQGSDVVDSDVFSLGSPSYSLRMLILGSRLSAMTTAALSTWLAANTPTIYYALATPTDTEITNAALIAQLEAILSQGSTYAGTNNITTVISAGNEQGELEVGYYTRYDFTITAGGYEWEQGGSGGPTTVMNESIDNVYPIWTITGPITNPVLENTTTGEQIEYVGTIGDGQTLVIDMGAQTALLDGLNVVANIVGEFLSLAPGSNTLIYSVDSGDKASEIGWSEIVG